MENNKYLILRFGNFCGEKSLNYTQTHIINDFSPQKLSNKSLYKIPSLMQPIFSSNIKKTVQNARRKFKTGNIIICPVLYTNKCEYGDFLYMIRSPIYNKNALFIVFSINNGQHQPGLIQDTPIFVFSCDENYNTTIYHIYEQMHMLFAVINANSTIDKIYYSCDPYNPYAMSKPIYSQLSMACKNINTYVNT